MNIPYLLQHPEELDQETLYDLRRIVAVYPTYHAARILFLQNLFLLHDPTFDQELRRAALFVPDRRVLFNITQPEAIATKHQTTTAPTEASAAATEAPAAATDVPTAATEISAPATEVPAVTQSATKVPRKKYASTDATTRLLDGFLDSAPTPLPKRHIKANPASDYMAYIIENDESFGIDVATAPTEPTPSKSKRMDLLITGFINSYSEGGINLPEDPDVPEETSTEMEVSNDPTLTETLANVYIQQQKYERAIEVLTKSQGKGQRSNPYLADQVRFLQKLAINERHKTRNNKKQQ